ncbi:MAG: cytochrome c [Candidatus Melainabacteria bacterium]
MLNNSLTTKSDQFRQRWMRRLGLATAILATGIVLGTALSACSVEEKTSQRVGNLVSEPVIDARLSKDDFGFPSKPPSLVQGKTVYENSCAKCHAANAWQGAKVQSDLMVTTPIDLYLMLSTGAAPQVVHPSPERKQVLPDEHPAFRDQLSRDDRWAAIFYTRYLAGALDIQQPNAKSPDVAAIFGGNCAVCHGKRGFGDGTLHIGKTGNHKVKDADIKHDLEPPPANFHDYERLYNRTDAQLFRYVCEGIYPSAMPAWYGNVHRDSKSGETVYRFDDPLIWNLIRHVRTFGYTDDLYEANPPKVASAAPALCHSVGTNQPWTSAMRSQYQYRGSGQQSAQHAAKESNQP